MRKPDVWIDGREARLIELTNSGLPNAEIATRLGCSVNAVKARQARLRADGRLPPAAATPGHYTPEEDARLRAMVAQGLPKQAMAARLGRSVAGIESRLAVLRRGGPASRHSDARHSDDGRVAGLGGTASGLRGPAAPPLAPLAVRPAQGPLRAVPSPPAVLPPPRSCAFPLWPDASRPTYQFCNARVWGGLPYCPEHALRCFARVRP